MTFGSSDPMDHDRIVTNAAPTSGPTPTLPQLRLGEGAWCQRVIPTAPRMNAYVNAISFR